MYDGRLWRADRAEQFGPRSNCWAIVLVAVLIGSKLPTSGKDKPEKTPNPVPESQHACSCGSDRRSPCIS